MSKRHLISTLAASLAIAAAAVPLATAASPAVIRLQLPGTKSTYVDLGPKSYSPGDYFLSSGLLVDPATHKQVGQIGGVWTILSRKADHATFDLGLAAGTIFVSGQIQHTAPTSTLQVTGGTGAYRDSHGTVTFRYLSETTAALDVRLGR
jgi:hypothetical protein